MKLVIVRRKTCDIQLRRTLILIRDSVVVLTIVKTKQQQFLKVTTDDWDDERN